jgi:alkylation response protein AidB-like acyl-CoA dehydrogenase
MDFDLSGHRSLMVDVFRDLLAKRSGPEVVRSAERQAGHDPALWAEFSTLGGHLVSVPEASGGGGGDFLDATLLGLECGRRVAPIAYGDAVSAVRVLVAASGGAPPDAILAGGLATLAPEWTTGGVHYDGQGLDGRIPWSRGAAAARWLVAVTGSIVALVDLHTDSVVVRHQPNLGHLPMGSVDLAGAPAVEAWEVDAVAIGQGCREARVLQAAELVGAGHEALALVLAHVKERRQFDRLIGSFQAVQHRLADRRTALEGAELLVLRAASYASDPEALGFYSAVALIRASEAAQLAAKDALQFFGGYGFTLEYDIHLYLRYAKALAVIARDPYLTDDALSRQPDFAALSRKRAN